MNEALMDNAERMFDLEFIVKQKAQLKYLQVKQQKFQTRFKIFNFLSHEFLWSPTPLYYLGTLFLYQILKVRFRLTPVHFIPMLAVPVTVDYYKRDYYVKQFPKEYKDMKKSQKIVMQIIDEKKRYVTLEQVLRFVTHLNMDQLYDQKKLLPISMD